MKHIFFTPGPSQLFPSVREHIAEGFKNDIPSISHRSEQFKKIFSNTALVLRTLLSIPEDYRIFFVSSGTEAMERTIENTVGEYSFHFVNGSFSKRFFETARELKKHPRSYEVKKGEGFARFSGTIPPECEVICVTQNETSTGVCVPMEFVYALGKSYPDMLIALDIVSSAPYADIAYERVDIVFFSVQKGFGLPSGLGVMIVSPKALEKASYLHKKGVVIGSYHSFPSMETFALKNQTAETPNVLAIYLLQKVARDMLQKGIEPIRRETDEKAKKLYGFFEKQKGYSLFVTDPLWRSKTVLVLNAHGGSEDIITQAKKQGIIVGSGYGDLKERQIRVTNFPANTKRDVNLLLGIIKKMSA